MWNSDWTTGEAYKEIEDQNSSQSVSASAVTQSFSPSVFTGEKYPGGMSLASQFMELDYWTLRQRSNELYHKNAYARGIIRRVVTNIITTGLHLESTPDESIIGAPEDSLMDWAEDVETRFFIYGNTPEVCDYKRTRNLGEIQRVIKTESFVGGDCLVVLRQHPRFKLPMVQVIPGDRIQTPPHQFANEKIVDGVEVDSAGRHVAFYVIDEDNPLGFVKVLARGYKTGRPQAKLIYGCDKREDGVRGVPFLGIAMQPLAEIDRYRDSAQRKATLNSILVSFIKRDPQSKRTTHPITGKGASRRDAQVDVQTDQGETRRVAFTDLIPGLNMESLAPGEEPVIMSNNGVDINFGAFEASILMGLAWALEIPPEILLLSFNKNYSASQAAINEFKMYLEKEREKFGAVFCDFLYQDWFLSMTLLGKIESGQYLNDYMDASRWDVARAWTIADWSGQMKPSTDLLKTVKAYGEAIDRRLITMARAIREIFGMKGVKVWKQLKKELAMVKELNDIAAPDMEKQDSIAANTESMLSAIADKLEDVA